MAESGRRGFGDPARSVRIRQLYEVRGAIDALAALLPPLLSGPMQAAGAAQAVLQAGRAISGRTPLVELIARDVDFHRAIYALSAIPRSGDDRAH